MRACKDQIKVIARNSPLSLLQVEEVFSRYIHGLDYTLSSFSSYGDIHKEISLLGKIPADFFTRELDSALINGEADLAIHSAKDLPLPLPNGLEIYALTEATDKTDSLICTNNLTLKTLPYGAKVATSSPKRKAEIAKIRPDLTTVSVRGTIEERIAQLDNGAFDALIVATCALQRLGLEERISERLPFETHPLQGHLALVIRKGDEETRKKLNEHYSSKWCKEYTYARYISGKEIASTAKMLHLEGIPQETPITIVTHLGDISQRSFCSTLTNIKHTNIKSSDKILLTYGKASIAKPTKNKVLATGSSSDWVQARGEVTHTPLIHTERKKGISIPDISTFDIIIFTSKHAVQYLHSAIKEEGRDISELLSTSVMSVGKATTKAINDLGIKVDYQSPTESAEGIIKHFELQDISGKRILLPRSSIGIKTLPCELEKLKNEVIDLPIYDTITDINAIKIADLNIFDEITFSSPSGVKAFTEIYGCLPSDIPLTAIGSTTEQEILKQI